ncbi:MAG TPA: hypothetical protein H9815_11810 [Candidatus Ruania gallistercoris]|uniref:non-specific serine/threonine protein kinase n=1 Tax=Candidatus Ruania gallistercoris TaxID=2838746 RepID=A0A9D2J4L3_9MICO|nr:hypothetical protein [Candidatus Ruania gallistercoris]
MTATVTIPGYTLTGVAGIGAQGAVRRGTDPAGHTVAIRVIAHAPAGLWARAEAAAQVRHPGIAAVRELVPVGAGFAVVHDFIAGPTLATLRAARRGLSLPECAQLAADLLDALAALHAVGIIHGDVSPANVIVTPGEEGQGRPVLVDLVGGAGPERGTRGFRAPEVETGAAPGTAADVYSAAQVALWAAEPGARSEVAALLAPLLDADPGQRPSARRAGQLLDGAAHQAIQLAPAEVLASATLREHAARELTTRARERRARPRRRHRSVGRRRWLLRGAGVAVLLTLVTGTLLWLGPVRSPVPELPKAGPESAAAATVTAAARAVAEVAGDASTNTATNTNTATDTDAELATAVRELLARRDAALMARDAVALAEVTVPGSPLAAADASLLADLTETGLQLRGYQTEVLDLTVLRADRRTATVRAELHQLAHERLSGHGRATQVPDQPPQCVQIRLERGPDSVPWRAVTSAPC